MHIGAWGSVWWQWQRRNSTTGPAESTFPAKQCAPDGLIHAPVLQHPQVGRGGEAAGRGQGPARPAQTAQTRSAGPCRAGRQADSSVLTAGPHSAVRCELADEQHSTPPATTCLQPPPTWVAGHARSLARHRAAGRSGGRTHGAAGHGHTAAAGRQTCGMGEHDPTVVCMLLQPRQRTLQLIHCWEQAEQMKPVNRGNLAFRIASAPHNNTSPKPHLSCRQSRGGGSSRQPPYGPRSWCGSRSLPYRLYGPGSSPSNRRRSCGCSRSHGGGEKSPRRL